MPPTALPSSLDALPVPLFLLREDGISGLPNHKWCQLFGGSQRWPEVIVASQHPRWQQLWLQAREKSSGFRFDTLVNSPQGWSRCLLAVEPQWDEQGKQWLIVATEFEDVIQEIVSDYEQDRVALSVTAQKFRSFFQDSASGKAMVSLDGDFLVVNPEICRIFGYGEEQLLQMSPRDLRHPDDVARLDGLYQELMDGGPPVAGVEGRYKRRSGQEIYLQISISLVRDSMRHPLYFAVELQDITARHAAEEALANQAQRLAVVNEELARSNAELERFAFIASHDLQEPLRKIRVFASRLQGEAAKNDLGEVSQDYLTRLVSASERMQQLIADLLAFSRLSRPPRFEKLDLAELAQDVSLDFETTLEELGGQLEIGALPSLEGDRSRLRQLLANLISNALKFRGSAPPLVWVKSRQIVCPSEVKMHRDSVWWEISVQDNGIGFDESELPMLLEVFGRLHSKDQYPGTGIGLAICRKVAQEHGGDIRATSKPGQGTTFFVSLPQWQSETAESGAETLRLDQS